MPLIIGAKSASATGYTVDNSYRINANSSYLSRTPGSEGNRAKWTFSAWFKGCAPAGQRDLINAFPSSSNESRIYIIAGKFGSYNWVSDATDGYYQTDALSRDPASWYHVVFSWDSDNAVAGDRIKMYINGTEQTSFATENDPGSGTDSFICDDTIHYIGRSGDPSADQAFYGYMAEVCLCDGQTYAASDFGEFDEDSPTIWKPKDVSELTFGTTGFYLDFEDSADLGADASGNSNDFTATSLDATDQATDTPTNNFATMNPLDNDDNPTTFSEGNNKLLWTATNKTNKSTIGMTAGKWYAECYAVDVNGGTSGTLIGVGTSACVPNTYLSSPVSGWGYRCQTGYIQNGAGNEAYGDTWTDDDIIGIAVDVDNGYVYMSKNGVWQDSGDPTSGASGTGAANNQPTYGAVLSGTQFFGCSAYDTDSLAWNFGGCSAFDVSSANQDENGYGNFEYAPPSGYLALCTKNLGSDGG